jgi:hypothetical protein
MMMPAIAERLLADWPGVPRGTLYAQPLSRVVRLTIDDVVHDSDQVLLRLSTCAMCPTTRTAPRSAQAADPRSWQRCATPRSACIAEPDKPTSPAPADDSQPTPTAHSTSSYKHEFPGHRPAGQQRRHPEPKPKTHSTKLGLQLTDMPYALPQPPYSQLAFFTTPIS